MEKINLCEVRGFSDSITVSFNFVKQEFVPLIKAFAIIALPLVFVDLFFKSFAMRSTMDMMVMPETFSLAPGQHFLDTLWSNLSTMVIFLWMLLFGISYLRVYNLKYEQGSQERIVVGEVWQVMCKNMGKFILWGILYLMMVIVGCMFCLVPGIYLSIIYFFTAYFYILYDKKFGDGMSASFELVKGNWWNLFGFVLLIQLIVTMLSYIFAIPYMVVVFKSMFVQEMPGVYETTFGILLASLGQSFLQIIVVVGGGVRFFSFLEQREHTGLIQKINQIGETV